MTIEISAVSAAGGVVDPTARSAAATASAAAATAAGMAVDAKANPTLTATAITNAGGDTVARAAAADAKANPALTQANANAATAAGVVFADGVARGTVRFQRLLRTFDQADQGRNPYEREVMASPPTVTSSGTSDNTLAAAVPLVASGALTSAATDRVAWYGGIPTPIAVKYVATVVSSELPSTAAGNLNGFAGPSGDLDMYSGALEIETDSDTVEFGAYGHTARIVMFQVNGQYVDKVGSAGAGANADNFWKLAFGTRKLRRIRMLFAQHTGTNGGATFPFQIRIKPTCSFQKPNQSQVLRCGWWQDSYGVGQVGAGPAYSGIPNTPLPVLAAELLGIRDVRQICVSGTGYTATGATPNSRMTIYDQVTKWAVAQGPYDIIVNGAGYNEVNYASTPAQIQAAALATFQLQRQLAPLTPIVVLGSQAGSRGPDSAILSVEAAIRSAVVQFSDPLCAFAPVSTDPSPWLFGTGKVGATNGSGNTDVYISADAVHPPVAGHEYLAFRAASAIRTAVKSMVPA